MKRETAKLLHDAASASGEAIQLCADISRDELRQNRTLQLAVQKLIEIVGEALRQAEVIEPALVMDLPDLRDVVDTRNRLVHGYSTVDYGLLWDITNDELPGLRAD
jgi:uncharacterized protein with HEPN domain